MALARIGAIGAGIGIGIDALIRKKVYRTASGNEIHAAPIVGRRAKDRWAQPRSAAARRWAATNIRSSIATVCKLFLMR